MIRGILAATVLIAVGSMSVYADDAVDAVETRILVTFSDPGMSNATSAGPPGPGYRRRSSSYLPSIDVRSKAKRIARDFDLKPLDEWPIVSLKIHCLVFGVASNVQVEELLLRLRQRPEVESAQPLHQFEVTGTNRDAGDYPYLNLQPNLDTLELLQAHVWSRGDGTSVTIIDTGADLEHPELKFRIKNHVDFVAGDERNFSADAHGTAVAGVIGAATNDGVGMTGVAPSTDLSVLRACWHDPNKEAAICNSFTLAKAIAYSIESDTDIINLSLGGPSDALLGRLLRQAIDRGIVVVAAASGQTKAGFPAEVPGVIVVGPSDDTNSHMPAPGFSISAPGTDILVPVPHGGYDYASGSSLSAAHVSGIVALLVARQNDLSIDQINTLLVSSRATVYESVNACRALAALLHESGCRLSASLLQSD